MIKRKKEDYDTLYPDLTEDTKIATSKQFFEEPVKEEVKKEMEIPIPEGTTVREAIINRLDGMANIAREVQEGKYSKIIRLSDECKILLEKL